jgi:hypothetical protein
VQVVWLKEALASPETDYGPWPIHANALKGYLDDILDKTASFFPNVQMVFFSPRTRAWTLNGPGFDHSPEPDAYETGFADKWVIQEQLEGRTGWPWLSWGPYIWADGLNPRSDTLTWPCSDVVNDCVHPTVAGVTTVVDQLLAFFRTDPVATPWFLRAPDLNGPSITSLSPTSATITVGGHVDFQVQATAHAGRTITEYMWTFDDGDYAYMTKTPRKYFYAPSQVVGGISYPYQVHFTVIDNTGSTAFATIPVTVNTPAPGPRHGSPEHAEHR